MSDVPRPGFALSRIRGGLEQLAHACCDPLLTFARGMQVDEHPRQVARYEAGEQQPVLSAAVALAEALQISIAKSVPGST